MTHRIGLYTPWDVTDPGAWSGMIRPMVSALQNVMDVEVLPRIAVDDAPSERLRARVRGQFGRPSLPRHTMATSRRRSEALRRILDNRTGPPLDAVVSIAGSTDVLDLPPGLPLIQVTDATFPAITGFYPLATGLGARNERQGRSVEAAGARATSHYAVATQWAARSLVEDAGVSPDRISVVPFGPGTPPIGDASTRRPGSTMHVLAVIGDWERKRGDDVVRAVDLARRVAPLELTVVGRAPATLPAWVRNEGLVARDRLAAVYAEHDILVDLAHANAAGVVMTDALCAGLPVVATRVGGVETIVRDGVTGWLVDPSDSAAQAARVLASLAPDQVAAASAAALLDSRDRLDWPAWAAGVCAAVSAAVTSEAESAGRLRRIAMVSPTLPSASGHETAGERLVRDVLHVMEEDAQVTVITPDGPANRRALSRGGTPSHRMIPPNGRTRLGATLGLTPALQPRDLAPVEDVIASADVIDVQWEENGLLLPALRRLNPDARLVITLHDVLSQRFARQLEHQHGAARRVAWQTRRLAAHLLERAILRTADDVVVLSEKDADLLPSGGRRARVHVVPPPIHGELRPVRNVGGDATAPLLLFVGFMARWENEDAMYWFVNEILPQVRVHVPDVRVAVAGGGLRDHVVAELQDAGVEVLGFVDDLESLYDEAHVVIAPLRYGAGVKFKVVDALVRGIPVVATSVGNEGIHPANAAVVADEPADFAAAVLRALLDPPAAEWHARAQAALVADEFGPATFRARMKEIYS